MKAILTHQSAKYQGSDVFVINGNKSTYSGYDEQKEAQSIIEKVSKQQFKKRIPVIIKASSVSKYLKIYISDSQELVISSNFSNKDEKGRNISFDFYCNDIQNPAKVVRLFEDYCRIAEMTPNADDSKTVEKYLSFYNNRKTVYIVMGICIIFVLWVITKLFS